MTKFEVSTFHGGSKLKEIRYGGQLIEFIIQGGKMVYAASAVPLPPMATRTVSDGGKRWYECGFLSSEALTGNPGAGWVDANDYAALRLEYSLDLVTWVLGKFTAAPVPVVAVGDGTFWYWSRAINPTDAEVKTGALIANNYNGDSRNNGFTSLVLAGVAIALGGFPYDMAVAGTAARLQADIRARGFSDAVVTGTTAANWTVSIPTVNYTSYQNTSYLGIPSYLIADIFGALTVTVDRINFSGNFVDASGVPLYNRAFSRLGISAGIRYFG